MGQEIRKKKVRIALLVALWLAVLALAGGLVLVKLADVQRRDQLALMGRLAVLYEGSETDFLEAVMQEPTDEDYAAGYDLLAQSSFSRRGYRELGRTNSSEFFFYGWCMIAALGVLLLLFYGWREIRRYRELNVLGESLFLWKRHLPDPKEPEAKYFRDCLERCQEELEKDQAAQEENMQKQTRYLENLVHQIKTPLAGISLYHNYLEDMETEPVKQDLLMKSRVQIDHMETLVRQMMLLTRLDNNAVTMKLERVVMEDIMLRVEQMTMGLSREKHQKVCWDYTIEQEVLCDCFWIQEVLINLMRNAIEHTPEYGHIRIWTEETDSCVNINIQDDGPGIPREDQQQIFRRFFTDVSIENGRNTGIGLNLAYEIIMKHGGRLAALDCETGAWFQLQLYY
ncbi:HAMP domain-containing histidine kinase [Lachnospiraceae bacterium CLA-AA-H215]|uniref:histidine kinase n=1 Tax=Hominifimenecus microfluidus TaxID=2885348 RepID=A0AAE3JF49_9FIRM|nr:HAMP domain-containing sensor histidine kinase [Hominifimenecus microfluidus]MCC2231804.1 HAMP domain-containing histidine kinase [Hominifimenecus microfluidus]